MRMFRVSVFLPLVTQQIHSLRASGVRLSHAESAAGVEIRAARKSAGILCSTPAETLVIGIFYQISGGA